MQYQTIRSDSMINDYQMHKSNLKHQQITIDSQLFEQIVDCLTANCGGDAACNLVLNQLQSLGLYDRQERTGITNLARVEPVEVTQLDRSRRAACSGSEALLQAVRIEVEHFAA